jgi:hypothetical protein
VTRYLNLIGLLMALVFTLGAHAQSETLGSILDKGAKKMSSAEVKAAVISGTLNGTGQTGEFALQDVVYATDGSVTGFAPDVPTHARGEWSVDANGLQCTTWHWVEIRECQYLYTLGDLIYVLQSQTETDRGQPVSARSRR